MPWSEPSDEQLARFACVSAFGVVGNMESTALALIQSSPEVKAGWMERHKAMQAAADALAEEHPEC